VNIRIILADDHPFVLLGMRAALENQSGVAIVGEAVKPGSLIALLQTTPCDVLVTDLVMPDTCGAVGDSLDLVTHIRRAWPRLRIVVVTTLTNAATLQALLADSEVSVLSKSQSMRDLRVAVEVVRGGGCYIGRAVMKALASPETSASESGVIRASDTEPLPRLTGREAEVLHRMVSGESIAEIAATLGCHRTTVMRHKREAMTKLGVTNDPGLFSYVRSHRILNFQSHI
jgi:two-component system capsular synthesis response regulator RcsB